MTGGPTLPAGWNQSVEALTHSRSGDERTIWQNVTKSGHMFRKHVSQVMRISNYAVYLQREGQPDIRIPFMNLTQVVALNSRYSGTGIHYTSGTGSFRSRSYMGMSSYSGHSVGDLLFMQNANVVLRFNQVNDAYGLARTCNMLIKEVKGVGEGMRTLFN